MKRSICILFLEWFITFPIQFDDMRFFFLLQIFSTSINASYNCLGKEPCLFLTNFSDTPHCSWKLENVRLKTLNKTSCDATYHVLNKFSSRHAYLSYTCLVNTWVGKRANLIPYARTRLTGVKVNPATLKSSLLESYRQLVKRLTVQAFIFR